MSGVRRRWLRFREMEDPEIGHFRAPRGSWPGGGELLGSGGGRAEELRGRGPGRVLDCLSLILV